MNKFFGIITAALFLCGLVLSGADKPAPAKKKPLPVSEFLRHFEKTGAGKVIGPKFSPGVYLGTAGSGTNYNTLTLGWGASGVLWQRAVAIVYIRENRFSYRFFEQSPVFVLSWYPPKYTKQVYKIFGGKSGRNTDKEKVSGFTPVETPDGGVTYLEADKVVVCRKLMRQPVPKEFVPKELQRHFNTDGYLHIQYTGEVLSVWRKKAVKP